MQEPYLRYIPEPDARYIAASARLAALYAAKNAQPPAGGYVIRPYMHSRVSARY